jgi:uncharacterized repeat protein (TIGR01451 family)
MTESRVGALRRVSPDRRNKFFAARFLLSVFLTATLLLGAASTGAVFAQPAPQSIFGLGDAVVTGFSGTVPPDTPLPPGLTPEDKTFIDLEGPSAQVIDLQEMGGAPEGQVVEAPTPFTATAEQIGQVFAVTLDGELPPNVYVAATSAYGLPIVMPDADGDGQPDRTRLGAPNASFMPGLWGPEAQQGGPGSIWKIDGATGEVSLFANVTLDGTPNSGPALGGLAFDPGSNQLFVADRDTGMIHRFTLDGVEQGRFDHGVAGRTAAGLPPVPFNPASRLDITSPAFNSEQPATWALAAPERLVFGLGVRGARLFYAVSDGLSIWSVSILPDGSFGDDARLEIQVPPALAPTEVAKIIFDNQGRMLLAERGAPVGAYDFNVLAQESVSRVLRYALIVPAPGEPAVWQPEPDEYAIGFALQNRNANGGVAIGYGYDEDGRLDRLSCGGTVWASGETLRRSLDPAVAKQLQEAGPLDVNGLQGVRSGLIRPDNVPPGQSYFIEYDEVERGPDARGHVGDIAIPRICGQGEGFGWFGGPAWFPPGYLVPDFGLPPPPPPPPLPNTNLRLDKWSAPADCSVWGGGWLCRYRVRVTSTGPDPYIGPIVVEDWLPANPGGAIMGFGPAPWACGPVGPTAYQCLHPAVVLNPGSSIMLSVSAWVPNAYPNCNLVNAAEIVWAPGGDMNPGDDFDTASAAIPAKHCPPKDKQTNLRMEKRLLSCYDIAGPQHRCAFRVTITNTGPGVYNDHIHFTDEVPAGTTAIFSSPAANPFTCAGGPPTYTCQSNNPVTLNPTDQTFVTVRIDVPDAQAPALKCQVRNEVAITQAPGGSPQNTNKADDTASATGNLPALLCPFILPVSNLRLDKNAQNGTCHGVGGGWQCDYTVRVRNTGPSAFSGQINVLDWIPPFSPPGTKVSFNSPHPWNCGPILGNVHGCSINANLAINQFRHFHVRVFVPLQHGTCQMTNTARIIQPPSPSLQNLNAGDDLDSATAQFLPLLVAPFNFYCLAPAMHEPEECPPNAILNRATGQCMPLAPPPPPPPPPPPGPPCKPGQVRNALTGECISPPPQCGPGEIRDARTGRCIVPPPRPLCREGQTHVRANSRCVTPPPPKPLCREGQTHVRANSRCVTPPPPKPLCREGQTHVRANSRCVTPPPPKPLCREGQTHVRANSRCVTPPPPKPLCREGQAHVRSNSRCFTPEPPKPTCPQGQNHVRANSRCVTPPPPVTQPPACPRGQFHNRQTSACAPIVTPPPPTCPRGQRHNTQTSRCEPIITAPPTIRPIQPLPQIR